MSKALKFLSLLLIILGFVWIIFAIKFSGINRENMTSMWFSQLFRGTMGLVIVFLIFLIMVAVFGTKISDAPSPSNLKVMAYGLSILIFVMAPMFIIGGEVGEL